MARSLWVEVTLYLKPWNFFNDKEEGILMSLWWEIEITDPDSCTGHSIQNVLTIVHRFTQTPTLSIGGMFLKNNTLIENPGSSVIMDTQNALDLVSMKEQIEWADFYFCQSFDVAQEITNDEPFTCSIQKAIHTVRVADNTYIFVYTQSSQLLKIFRETFPISNIKYKEIEKMKFMY